MKILLVAYDNDSYIHWFPIGLAYVAAVLRKEGHEVSVYDQDFYHYPESHLKKYLTDNKFDAVCTSVIGGYYQYKRLLRISEAINDVPDRPLYIIGGHGPAPEPEYFLKKTGADAIVIGEGEVTAVELFDALENDRDLALVDGIAFTDKDGSPVVTKPRQLITDLDSIVYPAWDIFKMDYYSLLRMPHSTNTDKCFPVLSARGCPYTCNFCYRMDKGIRVRSDESIIDEIKLLKEKYNATYIIFADELLMISKPRTRQLCQAIIDAKLDIKWSCNGRLNYASTDVLELMKDAGCVFINYGIECMDNEMLKVMKKDLTVDQVIAGIEATLEVGISPGYNIIFGNIGENKETLTKGVEFLLKYDDHAQMRTIRPVTPYPGSPLYDYAIEKGLLKDVEDFYENKHTNSDLLTVNFTTLSDDEFYAALYEANKLLLDSYYENQHEELTKQLKELYLTRDSSFRGFRHT